MTGRISPKIAIFGAGSIGCYLGGLLADVGCDVIFIGREKVKWGAKMRGLTLTHFKRKPVHIESHEFLFYTEAHRLSEADIVLVTVKSQDTLAAAREFGPHLKSDAMVVSFQNGVRNVAYLMQALPNRRIVGGMVPFNVTSPAVAEYHCGTDGDLVIEKQDDPRIDYLVKAFKKAGQATKAVSDIQSIQWGKLIINLNNAMNTLHGDTLKTGLAQKDYRLALAAMMEEAVNVTKQAGIEVGSFGGSSPQKVINILRKPNWVYGPISAGLVKIDANARSSMLDDLDAGKKCEVDYLQGEIIQLAEESFQRAPINEVILEAVRSAFQTGTSPHLTGTNMWQLVQAAQKSRG